MCVLKDGHFFRQQIAQRLLCLGISIGPERLHRVECAADAFLVSIAVLNDDALDSIGMLGGKPVPNRRTVVLHIDAELLQAQILKNEILDMCCQVVEGIFELLYARSIAVAESQIVRSDNVELVRQLRYQLAKHVRRTGEAVQEYDRG